MKYLNTVNSLLLAGLVSASGVASANMTTINFDSMASSAYGGAPNSAASGACTVASCYEESGYLFGIVSDGVATNHFHQEVVSFDGTNFNFGLSYHNDSSGVYMRREDGAAFNVWEMDFSAAFGVNGNFRSGTWEILGFGNYDPAINPNLSSGDGTNYSNVVAYQTVNNLPGDFQDGLLTLNSDFNSGQGITALWLHFAGAPNTTLAAPGLPFKATLDNIKVESVAAVPVPAAVWLLGSGLLGLVSMGRKKTALAA